MHTLLVLSMLACGTSTTETVQIVEPSEEPAPAAEPTALEEAPAVAKVAPDALREVLFKSSGHVRVFNFWATWCQPCIAELPHLARLQAEYPEVEVVLVSLDHRSIGTPRVSGFLKSRGLPLASLMLDAEDPAAAMGEVYGDFPGAIPVTLVVDGDGDLSKAFHRAVTYADLETAVGEAR
ncbi:MAG: TlpA family protein disulfide reductase [Proteobacteria bacterium]|nr:TlpA family protein disulfide reductase [Pseudomonadota bacterium]